LCLRLADPLSVKIPCGYCRNAFPKVMLRRVGNRLLCRRCFTAIRRAGKRESDAAEVAKTTEARSWTGVTHTSAIVSVVAKGVIFFLFFLWARASEIGAGALRGAVGADLFTWAVFSLMEFPFRRFRFTLGAVFEVALLVFYTNRGAWLEITTDLEATALSVLFFFLVLFVKVGVWAAERTLEVSGVSERASE
jgi:hypothetical protein